MTKLMSIAKSAIQPIDLVKYSGASGDFNEVHTVRDSAMEQGHPDVLVHGMFLMGWAGHAIEIWFPDQELQHFEVRFQAVTYPGTELVIHGEMVSAQSGYLVIQNNAGEIKLTGKFDLKETG